jgi:hypothetical protein
MSKPRRGWFPVEEAAMQKLSAAFDKPSDTRNALLCYVVLCRKANLKRTWQFEDTIASMSKDLFMAYRDAQKALELVEAAGLLKIERRKIPGTNANAPSLYTVVKPSDNRSEPPDIMSAPYDNTSEASRKDHVHDESRTFPKTIPKNNAKTLPKKHDSKESNTSFLSEIPEDRRQFLLSFNQIAKANKQALLPVDIYTDEVDKALDVHEGNFDDLLETIKQEVENLEGPPDKALTLVRIVWSNY